jgi:alkylhydroperoxidase family enzyme
MEAIINKTPAANLEEGDRAVMQFAQKVVRDASSVTEGDIGNLRKVGLTDDEIFDIAGAAAARCFFSKILDALGTHPDNIYNELDEDLRKMLTVGRPIE